jgi:hypothetical protein
MTQTQYNACLHSHRCNESEPNAAEAGNQVFIWEFQTVGTNGRSLEQIEPSELTDQQFPNLNCCASLDGECNSSLVEDVEVASDISDHSQNSESDKTSCSLFSH